MGASRHLCRSLTRAPGLHLGGAKNVRAHPEIAETAVVSAFDEKLHERRASGRSMSRYTEQEIDEALAAARALQQKVASEDPARQAARERFSK